MSRAEYITASSVSRFINNQLGYQHPFTVRQFIYIEVMYNPRAQGIREACVRLMQTFQRHGYNARYGPTGDKILVVSKERRKS